MATLVNASLSLINESDDIEIVVVKSNDEHSDNKILHNMKEWPKASDDVFYEAPVTDKILHKEDVLNSESVQNNLQIMELESMQDDSSAQDNIYNNENAKIEDKIEVYEGDVLMEEDVGEKNEDENVDIEDEILKLLPTSKKKEKDDGFAGSLIDISNKAEDSVQENKAVVKKIKKTPYVKNNNNAKLRKINEKRIREKKSGRLMKKNQKWQKPIIADLPMQKGSLLEEELYAPIDGNYWLDNVREKNVKSFKGGDRLVSLALNEDALLKDVIIEISRVAGIDIEFDHRIDSRIIMRVNKRPLAEVLDRIAENCGIRYTVDNDVLKFSRDDPYVKNYYVDFINVDRKAKSSFDVNTKVLGSGSSAGDTSGYSSSVSLNYDGSMWIYVTNAVRSILEYHSQSKNGDSVNAQNIQTEKDSDPKSNSSLLKTLSSASDKLKKEPAKKETKINDSVSVKSKGNFSINRQAGIITVFAKDFVHADIKQYLEQVAKFASSQVLIEAKIVEVVLNDEYSSGIDWAVYDTQTIATSKNLLQGVFGKKPFESDPSSADNFAFKLFSGMVDNNLSASVSLLEQFGEIKIVSSPRIATINNHEAVITFVKNHVYFDNKVTSEASKDASGNVINTINVNSSLKTVPVGVILSIQPSIDIANNVVSMNVRPTVSRITQSIKDPSVEFALANSKSTNKSSISSQVPIVEVRSLESMVRISSGNIMVLGGLHETRSVRGYKKIPLLGDIPLVGNFLRSEYNFKRQVETIILIKATIVKSNRQNAEYHKYFLR